MSAMMMVLMFGVAAAPRLPGPELNLKLAAPIDRWDEAIPLGNGLLGGLLWGQGNTIRLSLDRGDLWDERPARNVPWDQFNYATLRRLVAEGRNDDSNRIFDGAYGDSHPTKLPAGRLEITLDPARQVKSFELDLATAQGRAFFAEGRPIETFFSAAEPVALMRIPGPEPQALKLRPPGAVSVLGYPAAKIGSDGRAQWFLQEAADGLSYCVSVETRRDADETLLAVTVASTQDGPDPVRIARARTSSALARGYEKMLVPHRAYWKSFWEKSSVSIPDADILRHYYLVQYFYGAASRRGAPPMPLQGVWTADEDGLPPWKGDYHNDLNTQMTYIAYQTAGRFDEGACYLDFLWNLLPTFRRFAKDFYDAPGAALPGVMSLAGRPLGGWCQYSLSPTMGAWTGHLFYLHWRYTDDDKFLRTRAYPWCREMGQCLRSLLKPDEHGILKLPLSTSPEINDASAASWLVPNSNFDIACLRMFFLGCAEMADACGQPAEAKQWTADADALGPLSTDPDGTLKIDAKSDLPYSHRHLSNIMSMYPFNLVTTDGGAADRRIIDASLKQWDKLGTMAWCGYSFGWMSCLRARVGEPEEALRNLDIYVKAFILRNGFHCNGDQSGMGFSGFGYRPFTLEGNFLGAQAVQEMLLQSWSPTPGHGGTEVLRIFPATPWRWHDASFDDLRAEGGARVSARRENNATVWLHVVAGHDGVVRIRDNFGGRAPKWNRSGVRKIGQDFQIALTRGQTIEATFTRPAALPPKPADAYEPIVIKPLPFLRPNKLPVRIGADSLGGDLFRGEIAAPAVFNRALSPTEIAQLAADRAGGVPIRSGLLIALDLTAPAGDTIPNLGLTDLVARMVGKVSIVDAPEGLGGKALHLDGGFLQIAHDPRLDCPWRRGFAPTSSRLRARA